MRQITEFKEEYFFLSNFFSCYVNYKGITYNNSEAAFQAQKCITEEERKSFSSLSPSEAKKKGRHVLLRDDWEEIKLIEMENIVRAKFSQNKKLKEKLIATDDAYLTEGNWWNDTYWGMCKGNGENHLGKILMKIREEMKNDRNV